MKVKSMKVKITSDSLRHHGLYSPWNSPGQNTGVRSLSLLQGIFPTQGWNPGLPHCGQILYQLSHKGSPRILEWVAYPFSRVSSWPGIEPGILLHCRQILYQLSYQGSPVLFIWCLLYVLGRTVCSGIYFSYPKKQEIAQFLEASQEVHAYK